MAAVQGFDHALTEARGVRSSWDTLLTNSRLVFLGQPERVTSWRVRRTPRRVSVEMGAAMAWRNRLWCRSSISARWICPVWAELAASSSNSWSRTISARTRPRVEWMSASRSHWAARLMSLILLSGSRTMTPSAIVSITRRGDCARYPGQARGRGVCRHLVERIVEFTGLAQRGCADPVVEVASGKASRSLGDAANRVGNGTRHEERSCE